MALIRQAQRPPRDLRCIQEHRGHEPPERKIMMHTIEYDGANPAAPWKITTDDRAESHAATEVEAAVELAEWVIRRQQAEQALPEPALPEGAS